MFLARGLTGLVALGVLLGSIVCCGGGGGVGITTGLGRTLLAAGFVIPVAFLAVGFVWQSVEGVLTILWGAVTHYRAMWLFPLLGPPLAMVGGAGMAALDGYLPWYLVGPAFGALAFVLFLPWWIVGATGLIGGRSRPRPGEEP